MKSVIVEYKIKKNKVKEVKKAINNFIYNIRKKEPDTLLYAAFQENINSFVHIMIFKGKKAEIIHSNSGHCRKFVDLLYPNCTKKPEFTELKLLSSTVYDK